MIPKDILYTHKSVPVQLSQEKLPLSLNGTDRDTEADIIQRMREPWNTQHSKDVSTKPLPFGAQETLWKGRQKE